MENLYRCECCGLTTTDKAEIEKCEESHLKVEGAEIIGGHRYSLLGQAPEYIVVRFADGTEVQYRQDCTVKFKGQQLGSHNE